jgi:hypothetical protein
MVNWIKCINKIPRSKLLGILFIIFRRLDATKGSGSTRNIQTQHKGVLNALNFVCNFYLKKVDWTDKIIYMCLV